MSETINQEVRAKPWQCSQCQRWHPAKELIEQSSDRQMCVDCLRENGSQNRYIQQSSIVWVDGKRFCVDSQNYKVWNVDDPSECYGFEFFDAYGYKIIPDRLYGGDKQ